MEALRSIAGDDLGLIELAHPGLAPVDSLVRGDEGQVVARWKLAGEPLHEGKDPGAAVGIAARLLLTLEFLHGSGFVIEALEPGDVRVGDDGWPIIAPLSLVVARRDGELPYSSLLRRMVGEPLRHRVMPATSFTAWFAELARLGRAIGKPVPREIRLGCRPLFDAELSSLFPSPHGGLCRSFRLAGEPGCGRSSLLGRAARHALTRGARVARVNLEGRSEPRAALARLAAELRDGPTACVDPLDGIRAARVGCRGVLLLVDGAQHLDEPSIDELTRLADEEQGVAVGVAASGAGTLARKLADGLGVLELKALGRHQARFSHALAGATPGSRRVAVARLDRCIDESGGSVGRLAELVGAALRGGDAAFEPMDEVELGLTSDPAPLPPEERWDLVGRIDATLEAAPPEWTSRGRALVKLGESLLDLGRLPEAVEALEDAVEADPESERGLLLLAVAQGECMEYDEALRTVRRVAGVTPSPTSAARAVALEAEVLWKQGNLDGCRALLASPAARVDADARARLSSLDASMRGELGDVEGARRLFADALAIDGLSSRVRARILQRHGRCLKLARRIREASELYRQAERAFREVGDVGAASGCLVDMGNCARQLEAGGESLELYGRALREAEALGNAEVASLARFNRLSLQAEHGAWQDCREAFLDMAEADAACGHEAYLAMDQCWLGIIGFWMGLSDEAEGALERAEASFRAAGETANANEMALALAELYLGEQRLDSCRRAMARVERVECNLDLAARARALESLCRSAEGEPITAEQCEALARDWREVSPQEASERPTVALVAAALADALGRLGRGEQAAEILAAAAGRMRRLGHLYYEWELGCRLLRLAAGGGDARLQRLVPLLEQNGAAPRARELGRLLGGESTPARLRACELVSALVEAEDPAQGAGRLAREIARETRSSGSIVALFHEDGRIEPVGQSGDVEGLTRCAESVLTQRGLVARDGAAGGGPFVAVPLMARGETFGALVAARRADGPPYAPSERRLLEAIGRQAAGFVAHQRRALLARGGGPRVEPAPLLPGLVGTSAPFRALCVRAAAAAEKDVAVLLRGESGTGKELLARAIHRLSRRAARRFVPVNMGALPENLATAEISGARRGAYSGATVDRPGLAEEADGGTLFLDEIGDVGPQTQVALLRLLQEREVRRLGDNVARKVDVRFLFATHRDLEAGVREGWFRHDLYYRVAVVVLDIPPLRDRADDIPLLASELLGRLARDMGMAVPFVTPPAMAALTAYGWPGNVRQLENVLIRVLVDLRGDEIRSGDLPPEIRARARVGELTTLKEAVARFERDHVADVLARCDDNRTQAARVLGLSRQGLIGKLKALGLARGK